MPKLRLSADESFNRFWLAYPKKKARLDALKAWTALKPQLVLVEEILSALDWQTRSYEWRKNGGMFVPLPASWLRGERWTDEPPTADFEAKLAGWDEECQRLHNGVCESRYGHLEAMKHGLLPCQKRLING